MAGELEHIRPSNPSDGWYVAARTRNINWVDANGVSRSISHVYWSPTNNVNDRKLIWQRDHSSGPIYTTIKLNGSEANKAVAVKYVATANSINKFEILTRNQGTLNNPNIFIYNSTMDQVQKVSYDINNAQFTNEEINLDGTTVQAKLLTINNLNIQLNSGTTYYIYAGCVYASGYYATPLAIKNDNDKNGDYKIITSEDYTLEQVSSIAYTSITNDYKPAVKINGVQV